MSNIKVITGNHYSGYNLRLGPGTVPPPPIWTVDPTIMGGPWPGGLVVGTPGTADAPATYEYEINAVGTGDTSYATFIADATEYSGSLTLQGEATNAGGTTPVTSNALTMQRLRGVTRPVMDADYMIISGITMPADDVSLIVECVGYENVEFLHSVVGVYQLFPPLNFFLTIDNEDVVAYSITDWDFNTAAVTVGPEIVDGATRWFALITYDSAEGLRIRYAPAGAVASQTAVSALTGSLAGSDFNLSNSHPYGYFSGSFEAKVLSRVLTDVEFLAVVASPIGLASLDGDVDIITEYMPTKGTEAQEDTITVGTQITPTATIVPIGGSVRMIAGRLNAGDALTAPVWLVNPYISGENWPGGTLTGVGIVTPGAISSATYDWELDAVPSGDDSRFRLVGLSELGVEFVWAGIATNALGSTPSDSTAVEIVQVEGLIRASTTSRYLTRNISGIGSAGAIICHIRPTAVSSVNSQGSIISIGRQAGSPNKYGVEPTINATASPTLLGCNIFYGPNAGTGFLTGLELPAVDGTTDYYMIVEWTGVNFTAYVAEPGDGVWASESFVAGGSPAHSTSVQARAWHRATTAASTSTTTAGGLEGVVLDRVTTSDERDAILASANLAESGIFAATGILASLRPVGTVAVDGANATGAGVVGTWTVAGAGTDVVYGGFNVEV